MIKVHHRAINTDDAETRIEYKGSFGDIINVKNGIKIWDGTNWKPSNGEWRFRDEAVLQNRKFSMMNSLEVLSLRMINKRRFEGEFIDHESRFDARYLYQTLYYFPMGSNTNIPIFLPGKIGGHPINK